MPMFTYTGDDARYYPALSLEVLPGDSAELPEMPTDGRWSEGKPTIPAKPIPVDPTS